MADQALATENTSRERGRGRGKSRGGLGKYLRARGRGRGLGRPAEFNKRLVLEGEGPLQDEEEEEAAAERVAKYSRRQLGTNADRYAEPEPELGPDGKPIVEPEVDLSTFLERQRISDEAGPALDLDRKTEVEEEIDTSLAHITSKTYRPVPDRKGKVQQIEWDAELDKMSQEKAAADAARDLKARFRAKSEKLRYKPLFPSLKERKQEGKYKEAPPLPLPDGSIPKPKDPRAEMEEFLDGLLS